MAGQSKLDLVAAGAILIMFLGAYTLTLSRLGVVLIIGGAIVMLLLILNTYRKQRLGVGFNLVTSRSNTAGCSGFLNMTPKLNSSIQQTTAGIASRPSNFTVTCS